MRYTLLLFLISASLPTTQSAPTSDYEQLKIEGFSIYLNHDIAADDKKLAADVQSLLRVRLIEM
jgi:hypothetical protein